MGAGSVIDQDAHAGPLRLSGKTVQIIRVLTGNLAVNL
jgi:hypothetical protein